MKRFGAALFSALALGLLAGCESDVEETEPVGTEIIEDTDDVGPADGYESEYDSGIDLDPGVGNEPLETEPLETNTDLDLGDLDTDTKSAPEADEAPAVDEEPASSLPNKGS